MPANLPFHFDYILILTIGYFLMGTRACREQNFHKLRTTKTKRNVFPSKRMFLGFKVGNLVTVHSVVKESTPAHCQGHSDTCNDSRNALPAKMSCVVGDSTANLPDDALRLVGKRTFL